MVVMFIVDVINSGFQLLAESKTTFSYVGTVIVVLEFATGNP
jgi:hypothetical protein